MLAERLRLYIVLPPSGNLEALAEAVLRGGATAVQLRMKNVSDRVYLSMARRIRKVADEYDALFFVNDRVDIALLSGADGVHLGKEDLPVEEARGVSSSLLIGVTVRSPEEARAAERAGASYLGAGSVFHSPSKDAPVIGVETLRKIAEGVSIPVVAIGGINESNMEMVLRTGVAGVAMMSAVLSGTPELTVARIARKIRVFLPSPPDT